MPEARAILASPRVIHWYAQNADKTFDGTRISAIPIGIDFHTLSERPYWGEQRASPHEQEEVVNRTCRALPRLEERQRRVYVDFAWQAKAAYQRLGEAKFAKRAQIIRGLSTSDLVFCQSAALPRNQMWLQRGDYAFVLSLPGNGLDCHRTWEALALGHIVLVPVSSLDSSLYGDLPVVTVRAWDEITATNLNSLVRRFGRDESYRQRLTSKWWVEQMRLKAVPARRCHRHRGPAKA